LSQLGDLVAGPAGADRAHGHDSVYEVVGAGDPPVLAVVTVLCAGCGWPYYAAPDDGPADQCPDRAHASWRFVRHLPEPSCSYPVEPS